MIGPLIRIIMLMALAALFGMALWMFAIITLLSQGAFAHEHYPPECCSDTDCRVVPASSVKKVGDLWIVQTKDGVLTFPSGKVREPLDDQFHACWRPPYPWEEVQQPHPYCFFPAAGGV